MDKYFFSPFSIFVYKISYLFAIVLLFSLGHHVNLYDLITEYDNLDVTLQMTY